MVISRLTSSPSCRHVHVHVHGMCMCMRICLCMRMCMRMAYSMACAWCVHGICLRCGEVRDDRLLFLRVQART